MKLLLVHGSGGTGLSFYYQTRRFREAEAPDLPGHPRGKPCDSIGAYVEWLRGYIAAKGYGEVVLGGHSMGGAIALWYALHYPEELKALVLLGMGARLRVHPDYLEACRDPQRWEDTMTDSLIEVAPDVGALFMEAGRRVGPSVTLNDLLCCDAFDVMDRVGEITLPTLILCGEGDRMTPVKYSEYLARRISGARLVVVPGGTHYVHLEKPEEVNETLGAFLGESERG